MASSKKTLVVSKDQIDSMIRSIRGVRVMLDSDLAKIYGVPTFRFNEAIKRNRHRFPADFMFQLTREEFDSLTSQIAMSKPGRGGRRSVPYAFAEYDVRGRRWMDCIGRMVMQTQQQFPRSP